MGLILCKTIEAKKPYEIKNMGHSISSLEEFCYFLYNNIYLISPDIICKDLLDYISDELHEPKLSDSLNNMIERSASLSDMISFILKYVDYYSPEEINKLRGIIDSIKTKSIHERLFARANNLFQNGCIISALNNFELIINDKRDEKLDDEFYGKVYHNMGVAYARLFLFKKAFECFMEGYEYSKSEESKKEALVASYLYESQNGTALIEPDDEDRFVINHEMETLMNNAVLAPSYDVVKDVLKTNDMTMIEGLVKSYKDEYLKMTS